MEPRRVTLIRTGVFTLSSNLFKKTWNEKCRNPFLKRDRGSEKTPEKKKMMVEGMEGVGGGFLIPNSALEGSATLTQTGK